MRIAILTISIICSLSIYSDECQNTTLRILKGLPPLSTWRPPLREIGEEINNLIISIPVRNHTRGRLILMPQFLLTSVPGIEVVGSRWTSSRELVDQIVQNLVAFDHMMEGLGFTRPTLTKVLLIDKTLLPNLLGPASLHENIFNLWHASKANNLILMQPIFYSRYILEQSSTLLHERTHSVLRKTYHSNSYVFSNHPIQEALADFLAAHYRGEPIIRILPTWDRDISLNPTLPLHKNGTTSHDKGKQLAYVLWKLRGHMGKEEIEPLIKPFIDNLNRYYDSFRPHPWKIEKKLKAEYGYFVAVLKKTLQEEGHQMNGFFNEVVSDLGLDISTVDDIADSLVRSDQDFNMPPNGDKTYLAFNYIGGLAAIATEALLLYIFFF